jgi:hypothetical protein
LRPFLHGARPAHEAANVMVMTQSSGEIETAGVSAVDFAEIAPKPG